MISTCLTREVCHGPVHRSQSGRRRQVAPETPRRASRTQHGGGSPAHPSQCAEGREPACLQAGIAYRGALREDRPDGGPAGIARPAPTVGRFRQVIILDTNVLSALMRKAPEAPVVAWLDRQPAESVWI